MIQTRRGFTLIELLVVVSIIALLISILLPSLGKAKELANRVHCSANITGITKSFIVYGMENNDAYPIGPAPVVSSTYTPFLRTTGAVSSLTSLDATSSYIMTNASHQGDVFSPFYLLVTMQGVNPKMFICKSDRQAGWPAQFRDSNNYFYDGFQDKGQVCYSIVYPWSGNSRAPWWRNTSDTNQVVLSDMAPYVETGYKDPAAGTGKTANSENHEGAGQNVAYADGHGEFVKNPKAGPLNDNIFTLRTNINDTAGKGISEPAGSLPAGTMSPSVEDYIMVPTRSASSYELK